MDPGRLAKSRSPSDPAQELVGFRDRLSLPDHTNTHLSSPGTARRLGGPFLLSPEIRGIRGESGAAGSRAGPRSAVQTFVRRVAVHVSMHAATDSRDAFTAGQRPRRPGSY